MEKTLTDNSPGRAITFIYPVKTQAVSVTGPDCQLDCAHCGGHYLASMKPLEAMAHGSASSFLISGGCTADGKVPITNRLKELAALKQGRRFNFHVGLVDEAEIEAISGIADTVSFDLVGDDATIREVFGIDRTAADYAECYRLLRQRCQVVPHICIGLHGGAVRGEHQALEMLRREGTRQLTFIVFTPTRGTRYADRQPPALAAVAELFAAAGKLLPDVPVNLGCMRPGGRYRSEVDCLAVRHGVAAIVNPAPAAVRLAEELGLAINRREECCSL